MNKVTLVGVLAIISIAFFMSSVECRTVVDDDNASDDSSSEYTIPSLDDCICTMEFNPVCASNMVTYSNPCLYQCAADLLRAMGGDLTIMHYGDCE